LRFLAFTTRSAIRQTKPKGITRIGIIPQPVGTQVLFTNGAKMITNTAAAEITMLIKKPKARYFSTGLVVSAGLAALFLVLLFAILLEYWLD
jgi:hypothetical protein